MGACLSQQTGHKGRTAAAAPAAAAPPDWGCLPEELLVAALAHLSLEERCGFQEPRLVSQSPKRLMITVTVRAPHCLRLPPAAAGSSQPQASAAAGGASAPTRQRCCAMWR